MKRVDVILQNWRIDKAASWIPPQARLLDVGCADGALFHRLRSLLGTGGVGIDHDLPETRILHDATLYPGDFPHDLPDDVGMFDAITMLAVLEHVPSAEQPSLGAACAKHLRPGGRLILSVPSALVDPILDVMKAVRLIDGMSLEEHHGFDVNATPAVFSSAGFRLLRRERFQLGLNNLFVFER